MTARLRPYFLLAFLALVFFHPLVFHPYTILYSDHSDFPDLHVPARRFLVRSVHETGELPLWCPYQLSGSPFVHDIQVGIFYPPHALLYFLSEEAVGPALSWLVVGHVVLAGWFTNGYARWRGQSELGALVAGAGWMFAGRWMLHLLAGGHYVVIGLAWVPLVLLLLERAIAIGSLAWATAAGLGTALLVLGTQPQWTFYAGLLVVAWTLGAALEQTGRWGLPATGAVISTRRALVRWVAIGGWAVLVAAALTAVQLLPTAEAAREAVRAGGVGETGALGGGLRSLVFLIGPALIAQPHNLQWEDRGGLTLLWLAAAVTAGLAAHGRDRYEAWVALGLAVFAAGASALVQWLPPFSFFRQPPRMFILVGFPVAFLTGRATDLVFTGGEVNSERATLARRVLLRLLAAVAILTIGFALRSALEGKALRMHPYWPLMLITALGALLILRPRSAVQGLAEPPEGTLGRASVKQRRARWIWAALLLADLWGLTLPLVDVRTQDQLFGPPDCLRPMLGRPLGSGRLLDRSSVDNFPLGGGAGLARVWRIEAVRGYNPLDYRRYKEYLQFAGGSDDPLVTQASPLAYPVLADFAVTETKFLDLLNVRWLLQPADQPPPTGWRAVKAFPSGRGVFNFVAGDVPPLPEYVLYISPAALPRAFVVHEAAAMPQRDAVLDRMRQTDFRRVVLLEGEPQPVDQPAPDTARRAEIRQYLPNRVEVEVGDGPPGWLVLTDLWYPGWTVSVDGIAVPLLRADFLFRAVAVGAGRHSVVFSFQPRSFELGRTVSLVALGVVAGLFLVMAFQALVRRALQ